MQHSFSLLQSTARSKSSFHQDTKTGGGEFKGQSDLVSQIRQGIHYTLAFASLSNEAKDTYAVLSKFSHHVPLQYLPELLNLCYYATMQHHNMGQTIFPLFLVVNIVLYM